MIQKRFQAMQRQLHPWEREASTACIVLHSLQNAVLPLRNPLVMQLRRMLFLFLSSLLQHTREPIKTLTQLAIQSRFQKVIEQCDPLSCYGKIQTPHSAITYMESATDQSNTISGITILHPKMVTIKYLRSLHRFPSFLVLTFFHKNGLKKQSETWSHIIDVYSKETCDAIVPHMQKPVSVKLTEIINLLGPIIKQKQSQETMI